MKYCCLKADKNSFSADKKNENEVFTLTSND